MKEERKRQWIELSIQADELLDLLDEIEQFKGEITMIAGREILPALKAPPQKLPEASD